MWTNLINHREFGDSNAFLELLKTKVQQPHFTPDSETCDAIHVFIKFAIDSSLDVSLPIDQTNLEAASQDSMFVKRLMAIGFFRLEKGDLYLNWHNDDASIYVAKAIIIALHEKRIHFPNLIKDVSDADRVFQGRMLIAFEFALKYSTLKDEIKNFLFAQCLTLLNEKFFDVFDNEQYIKAFPEFRWGNLLRSMERSHFRRSICDKEKEFTFCLTILAEIAPEEIFRYADKFLSPARLMCIGNRFDVIKENHRPEQFSSEMLASFFSWCLERHFLHIYNLWLGKVGAWRSSQAGKTLYESSELLREKAKIDEFITSESNLFFGKLRKNPSLDRTLIALHHFERSVFSLKKNWQSFTYETDAIKLKLNDCLVSFLSALAKEIPQSNIETSFSRYLSQGYSGFTERVAILARIGQHKECAQAVSNAARIAIVDRFKALCRSPFGDYPHYTRDSTNKRDEEIFSIARFLFSDTNSKKIMLEEFTFSVEAKYIHLEGEQDTSFHQKMIVSYLCHFLLLLPDLETDTQAKEILAEAYEIHVKNEIVFGALLGLEEKFLSLNIVQNTTLVSENQFNPSTLTGKDRLLYSRSLIAQSRFEEAKVLLDSEVVGKFDVSRNHAGETSETLFYWMTSLYRTDASTKDQFIYALKLFEQNRECIGVNDLSKYELASAIAVKAEDLEKAIFYADRAIRDDPGNIDSWLNKAVVYLKFDDGLNALKTVEQLPSIYFDLDRVAHVRLAVMISAAEHLPKIAILAAESLLEQNDQDEDARYNSAVAHVLTGDFAKGIALCKTVLTHLPAEPLATNLLKKLSDESAQKVSDILKAGLPVKIPAIISDDFKIITVKNIAVGTEIARTVKIGIAQVGFPPVATAESFLGEEAALQSFETVKMMISEAVRQQAEMLFLPELTIPEEYKNEITELSKMHKLWIVGGARYIKSGLGLINSSVLFSPLTGFHQGTPKICISPKDFANTIPGEEVTYFVGTPLGKICVLICFDPYHPAIPGILQFEKADVIFVPGANRDFERIRSITDSLSSQLCVPVVVANVTNYGNSFYTAIGFKSELEEKFDRSVKSTTEKRDQLLSVTIASPEILKKYKPHRPSQSLGRDPT